VLPPVSSVQLVRLPYCLLRNEANENQLGFRAERPDPASTVVIGFGDRKTTAKLNNCSQLLTPHFPGRQARRSATNCLLV
jgi:hypothetical protein